MTGRELHEKIAESLGWRQRYELRDRFKEAVWESPDGHVHALPDFDTDEAANAMLLEALLHGRCHVIMGWNMFEFYDSKDVLLLRLTDPDRKVAIVNAYTKWKGLA